MTNLKTKQYKTQYLGKGSHKTLNMDGVEVSIHRTSTGGGVFVTISGFNSETISLKNSCDDDHNYVSLESWANNGQLVNVALIGRVGNSKDVLLGSKGRDIATEGRRANNV